MIDEQSCGLVLIARTDGHCLFHLVRNRGGHIGFPKGHREPGETEEQTALRETLEETGIRAVLEPGFREAYEYRLPNGNRKQAVYFIGRYPEDQTVPPAGPVPGCSEIDAAWLEPYVTARVHVTYEEERRILDAAFAFLDS